MRAPARDLARRGSLLDFLSAHTRGYPRQRMIELSRHVLFAVIMDRSMTSNDEAKDRLRRVFLFLKERSKLDSPTEKTVDKGLWQLSLADLPSAPDVTGALFLDTFDYGEERGHIVLEIKRPVETPCPEPGPKLRARLKTGWELLETEVVSFLD